MVGLVVGCDTRRHLESLARTRQQAGERLRAVAVEAADQPVVDPQSADRRAVQRRARISNGAFEQPVAQRPGGLLDGRREARGRQMGAGVRTFGQQRVAELDGDLGERNAQRLCRELRQHGVSAGADILGAAADGHAGVAADGDSSLRRRTEDREGG